MDGKQKRVRVTFIGGTTREYTLDAWLIIVKKTSGKKRVSDLQHFFDEDSKDFINSIHIGNIITVDLIK